MKRYSYWSVIIAVAALTTACATGSQGTRNRTNVPVGPVSTGSTSLETIPAGTTLAIRTNEAISAQTAQTAGRYSAEIAQDVVNTNGRTIIPRGAPATLTVLDASTGGTVGTSRIELALSSITVGGRTYTVTSDVADRTGSKGLGANERTARTVGGGAALGALLGAVAGGSTGALAGAAIGAAGGATAQVLTRGEAVRVPAEAVMTFQLEHPVRLR